MFKKILILIMAAMIANAVAGECTATYCKDRIVQYVYVMGDGTVQIAFQDRSNPSAVTAGIYLDLGKVGDARFDMMFASLQNAVANKLTVWADLSVISGKTYLQGLSIYQPGIAL